MLLETTQFYKSVAGMFYEANVQKDVMLDCLPHKMT